MSASLTLSQANEAFGNKDYDVALRLWTELLPLVDISSHYALNTNRGAALERLGRVDEAIEAYNQALRTNPRHIEALHNRGVAYRGMNKLNEAMESFNSVLLIDPGFLPSMRAVTDTLLTMGKYDEAVEAATRVIQSAPSDPGPVAERAFALLKAKKYRASYEEYAIAIRMGDTSAETQRFYAIALSQAAVERDAAGDTAVAEELLNKAIDMEPTESRILQRALLYMRTDRADLAINGLKRVTGMGPNNAVALSTLGTLLLQQDRATEALPYLERAMALRPQDAETAYNVGVVRLRVGRNDDALEAFRAAAAIDATMHAAQQGVYAAEAAIASSSAGGNPTAASGLPTLKVQRQTALESRTNEQALLAMTTTTRRAPLPKLRELQAEAPAVLPAYPLAELAAPGPFPEGVDPKRRELYLSDEEFKAAFNGVRRDEFASYPEWKRNQLKKVVKLW